MDHVLMITYGTLVKVNSRFIPDYNGLVGQVIIVKGHPMDPTMPLQFKVHVHQGARNARILGPLAEQGYVNLARPWEFWFVHDELEEV